MFLMSWTQSLNPLRLMIFKFQPSSSSVIQIINVLQVTLFLSEFRVTRSLHKSLVIGKVIVHRDLTFFVHEVIPLCNSQMLKEIVQTLHLTWQIWTYNTLWPLWCPILFCLQKEFWMMGSSDQLCLGCCRRTSPINISSKAINLLMITIWAWFLLRQPFGWWCHQITREFM